MKILNCCSECSFCPPHKISRLTRKENWWSSKAFPLEAEAPSVSMLVSVENLNWKLTFKALKLHDFLIYFHTLRFAFRKTVCIICKCMQALLANAEEYLGTFSLLPKCNMQNMLSSHENCSRFQSALQKGMTPSSLFMFVNCKSLE